MITRCPGGAPEGDGGDGAAAVTGGSGKGFVDNEARRANAIPTRPFNPVRRRPITSSGPPFTSTVPHDFPDDDPAGTPLVRLSASPIDRRPLYRVVEFVRDDRGRLKEEGRIWHTDLQRVRQFGRAVADNTSGSRVVIADASGRVVEELPLPGLQDETQGRWSGWRERRLPPLPASTRTPLKREARVTPAQAWVLPAPSAPQASPKPALPRPPSDVPTLGEAAATDATLP